MDSRYRKLILPLRKRATRHGYEVILNHHILLEFKDRQLAEITHEDIQGFANRKLKSGAAWNTVKNIVSVFSAVYSAALKYGYVRSNPVRLVEMPSEPVHFQPELPTDTELQRLQEALDEPYRTMVWLTVPLAPASANRWNCAGIPWTGSTIACGSEKRYTMTRQRRIEAVDPSGLQPRSGSSDGFKG